MARRVTQLTATEVKQAKPKDKDYDLYDGNGLQLRVRKNANKVWCLIYKHPVSLKRIRMTLGNYPDLSLAIVRKIAAKHRELISQGIDPKEHRQKKQEENIAITVHTLRNVSESWFDKKKKKVTPDHADDIWRSFELHLFPSLGKTPVSQISAPMVIKVLRPLEIKGNLETLKRVAQRLNEVMIFSVNTGLVHANPLAGIRAAFDTPSKKNMATIEPAELPDLMSALNQASVPS
ncbi:integrase arm-type DNA-binding domain-containing protein [Vibrio splendidus]